MPPWACARGEAFRAIASLELLGALVSVMVLIPLDESFFATKGLATLSCGTDNQGNPYLLGRLMTTKFSLVVVLMKLSCQLSPRRSCLHARWVPRLQNQEADALTHGDFRHFDGALRIPLRLENLDSPQEGGPKTEKRAPPHEGGPSMFVICRVFLFHSYVLCEEEEEEAPPQEGGATQGKHDLHEKRAPPHEGGPSMFIIFVFVFFIHMCYVKK